MLSSRRFARNAASVVVGALAIAALTMGVGGPAVANATTHIAFEGTASSAEFGADWVLPITVTAPDAGPLDTPAGTISVFIEGIAGAFAEGVPIFRGGAAFLTQPDAQPLLGAGDHRLSAVFVPAAGSALIGSQTITPYTLTITPLALDAHATIDEAVGDASSPYLHLTLSGAFVDALGVPAGTWNIAMANDRGDSRATSVDQPAGSTEPIELSLADDVRPGDQLEVTATFAPDKAVAAGITLTDPEPVSYQAPSSAPGELLTSSVLLPWWLAVLLLLLFIGAAAWLIVILVQRSRAANVRDDDSAGNPMIPSSPEPPAIEDSSLS